MEQVTKELFDCHEKYQPEYYISFGKQDEDLLKKFVSQSLLAWTFCDAIQFLPKELSMKYDISLEKYAYICQITFVHEFDPLEDARSLGTIVFRVLKMCIRDSTIRGTFVYWGHDQKFRESG